MSKSTRKLPPFSYMQEHATDAAGLMKALGNES